MDKNRNGTDEAWAAIARPATAAEQAAEDAARTRHAALVFRDWGLRLRPATPAAPLADRRQPAGRNVRGPRARPRRRGRRLRARRPHRQADRQAVLRRSVRWSCGA